MQIRNFSVAAAGWIFLFLSSAAGAWSVNDAYDNQSVGERCGSFWDGSEKSSVTSELSSSGSKSCKMHVRKGGVVWGGGISFLDAGGGRPLRKGDEYWMRFRLFMPAGFDHNVYNGETNLKFIRIKFEDSSGVPGYLDWKWSNQGESTPFANKINGNDCISWGDCFQFFGTSSDWPTNGTWETYEVYVKFDNVPVDEGGQGRMRAWKNGKLIGDLTRFRTIAKSDDIVKGTMLFSNWNGGSPKAQHLYLDDLVVTNERPAGRDNQGNAYIGMGNFVAVALPLPPNSIH